MTCPPATTAPARTSPPAHVRRVCGALASAAGAAVVASVLSACGAGQIAQTARQVAPIEGAQVDRGGIAIRAAEVATPPNGSYPAGSDAPMYAAIATDDTTSDTLVEVRTDAAASVTLAGGASTSIGSSPAPAAVASSAASFAASSSASPVAASSSASAASPSATSAPSATPSVGASPSTLDLRLAPATLTRFRDGGTYLELHGLTRTLVAGTTIKMTFSFARAGDVTFDVPVATPGSPGPRPTPSAGAE